jgi:hypothetical protein
MLRSRQNHGFVTTDGLSASLSFCQAPIWDLIPDFFFLTVACLFNKWVAPIVHLIISRHGPRRKHRSLSYSKRFRGNKPAREGFTQQRALFSRPLPGNGSFFFFFFVIQRCKEYSALLTLPGRAKDFHSLSNQFTTQSLFHPFIRFFAPVPVPHFLCCAVRVLTEEGVGCCAVSSLAASSVKCHEKRSSEENKNQYLLRLVSSSLLIPRASSFLSNSSALEYETRGKRTRRKQGQRETMAAVSCHSRRPPQRFQLSAQQQFCEATNHTKLSIWAAPNTPALWCKPMQTHFCRVPCYTFHVMATVPCKHQPTSAHVSNYINTAKFKVS